MPLRFRDRTRTDSTTPRSEPCAADEPIMVADNPPPIRHAGYLTQPVQSLIVPLPAQGDRWQHALGQMQAILDDWQLPPSFARRWLAAARPSLEHEDVVELYIELDPISHLISLEIWNDHGERVFGLDVYLPASVGRALAER